MVLISRKVDSELPPEEAAGLIDHLAKCRECACYVERCRALQRAIAAAVVEEPAPGRWEFLTARALDGLHRRQHLTRTRTRYRLAVVALAAACGVLLVVCLAGGQGTPGSAGPSAGGSEGPMAVLTSVPAGAVRADLPLEQASAFAELADYFGGELRWMAVDGQHMELGVSRCEGAARAAAHDGALGVRMWLLALREGASPRTVSSPMVMMLPGAKAAFRSVGSAGAPDRELQYGCEYATDGAGAPMLRVSVQVEGRPGVAPVELSASLGVKSPEWVPAAYARAGEGAYALYVASRPVVAPQPAGGGGA
jgi:hypothetical protein